MCLMLDQFLGGIRHVFVTFLVLFDLAIVVRCRLANFKKNLINCFRGDFYKFSLAMHPVGHVFLMDQIVISFF